MTSRNRNWSEPSQSYLATKLLPSLRRTVKPEHECVLYLGIDTDDGLFCSQEAQAELQTLAKPFALQFLKCSVEPGHVTKIWNQLFEKAYNDGHEYFFQCGDDVVLQDCGWIEAAIATLQASNGIGVTSPIDLRHAHSKFLTQSIVTRKHMDIFGYYFPEEIKNWFCDNWINDVYSPNYKFVLAQHLTNEGGPPRYTIVRANLLCRELVARDKQKLANYVKRAGLI